MSDKRHGVPNWVDCATTDLDAAEAFYAKMFGWTSKRIPGSGGMVYALQYLDCKRVAGLFELPEPVRAMGVGPHWETSIEVADLPAALYKVRAGGGMVLAGPATEPGVGDMATIQDPVGAVLRLWTSLPDQGGEAFNTPGALIWNELCTAQPDKAGKFYADVLGVAIETNTVGEVTYTEMKIGGYPVAGLLQKTPEMGDFPDSWDVYFAVDDVDAAVSRAQDAGATVLKPADLRPIWSRI
jgi:predicted enzyme related to lactoylglutathione lyase